MPRPEWLVFETDRGHLGDYEVFVMTTTGTRVANLTSSWADDAAPVWSPDGQRIAFVSWRNTTTGKWSLESGDIYLLDFDPTAGAGGDLFRLTDSTSNDGWPTWSPDGKRIAFQSERSGNWELWVINVDGTGLTQLTHHPEEDAHPDWSPDGTRIAFTSRRGGDRDIWVMNADGTNPVNLTNSKGRDRYPMWSPDGKQIAFNTRRDGDQEIYVMNADGSNQRNVTNSPNSTEGLADWSPDGKRLVLYSGRTGNKEIFILDLATGKWENISRDPASDEFCTWSP
jgi:Tol biopolymer transport system component